MSLAALYALLLAVLAGPLGPLLGAVLGRTGPVAQSILPFVVDDPVAFSDYGQVHCYWSGDFTDGPRVSMWLRPMLDWPAAQRDANVLHEYLHALDCLDNGRIDGSPLPPGLPVGTDPTHTYTSWALTDPAWALRWLTRGRVVEADEPCRCMDESGLDEELVAATVVPVGGQTVWIVPRGEW